jgi:hypothetical protein
MAGNDGTRVAVIPLVEEMPDYSLRPDRLR